MDDNRHYGKVYQWDKFYIFSEFFKQWKRVVFLDAGIRILDSVEYLLGLPYKGKFLSPDDSDPYDNGNRLKIQFDWDANPVANNKLIEDFGIDWFSSKYFLNCIFLFDTSLLQKNTVEEMKEMMMKYPISLCNEMGIMNLYWTVKHKVWEAFPQRTAGCQNEGYSAAMPKVPNLSNNAVANTKVSLNSELDNSKYLFGWSELNYRERPTWQQFCFLKYSSTKHLE
jgi:hypothetical protein